MLSLFSGTESERERLVRASQSLLDSLEGCILATHALLRILNQHLDTSVSLEPVGGSVGVGESLERLLWAAWEMHAAAEQTDRHVRKNTSRDLYARMASPHTSLQEKGAIVRDFHQATMGIFGSVGGPMVAVLLQNAGLPERLEVALRELEASGPAPADGRPAPEQRGDCQGCVRLCHPWWPNCGNGCRAPREWPLLWDRRGAESGRIPARCRHGASC
ncbi:uncharacterized protein LOC135974972 [Chrysemys picta bellii]|uniref:uncharacterized protein LOC135974972 n=1 Tax=Chrysemys picta bellii TaxID=8478 RepID=UPI0032B15895